MILDQAVLLDDLSFFFVGLCFVFRVSCYFLLFFNVFFFLDFF